MGPAILSEGYAETRVDSRAVLPKDVLDFLGPEVTSAVGWETARDRFRRHRGKLVALGRRGAPI